MESEGEVVRGIYMRQLQRLGAIGEFECRVCVCVYIYEFAVSVTWSMLH